MDVGESVEAMRLTAMMVVTGGNITALNHCCSHMASVAGINLSHLGGYLGSPQLKLNGAGL